jgi:signal transduction histidine kinase
MAWRLEERVVDAAIALGLTVLTQVELASASAPARAALLLTVVLAVRRRAPLAVAAVVAIAVALQGLATDPPSVFGEFVSVCLAVYTVAEREPTPRAAIGLVLILVGVVLHDIPSKEYGTASGMVSDLTPVAVFWAVGLAVKRFRTTTEHARAETSRAIVDERRRIARELHDVVTHSLGIVILQAQGAHRFLDGREPEVTRALTAIETSGRSAMTEMRRLLGLLRDGDEASALEPQPRIDELPALLARVRSAGLAVELRGDGDLSDLPAAVELSVYRIVQEALTNALRHAGAARAQVLLVRDGPTLRVEVIDDGRGPTADRPAGRGLIGMRERVSFLGGTLTHGAGANGGFRVAALLPLQERMP